LPAREPMGGGARGWLDSCRFDCGRPGRREVLGISTASLLASLVVTVNAIIFYATQDSTHRGTTIVQMMVVSVLDALTGALVIWRFIGHDALQASPYNHRIELRVSILVAATLVVIGLVQVVGASKALGDGYEHTDSHALTIEICLDLPASSAYLVIGVMQLMLGCALQYRSLQVDAMMSILGAAVGIGAQFADSIALSDYSGQIDDLERQSEEKQALLDAYDPLFRHGRFRIPPSQSAWWLSPTIEIVISIAQILYAINMMRHEASEGARFWEPSFWGFGSAPTPMGVERKDGDVKVDVGLAPTTVADQGAGPMAAAPTERTPLAQGRTS